jgi:hypothetical protein
MDVSKEKSSETNTYYPNGAGSACVLCGSEAGALYFKGKIVCEECHDLIKNL